MKAASVNPNQTNPTAKPAERLGYLGMALFVGSLLMTPVDKAEAATFTVSNTDDSGAGSLRQAIIDANGAAGPDDVVFAAGVTGSIYLTTGEMAIDDPVTITGPGQGVLSIDADGTSRIFNVDTENLLYEVAISGLTLTDGYANGDGGAIYSRHSHLTITDCTISSSSATNNGGGIYFYGYYSSNQLNLNVTGSAFTNNRALGRDGGGIYAQDGLVTITNSTFTYNYAGDDGGAFGADDLYQLDITDSTFQYNRSYGSSFRGGGGAINLVELRGPVTITGSTISDNDADHKGGGIAIENTQTSDPVTIDTSYIEENYADYNGGGIYAERANLTISNSTIAGNDSRGQDGGGGIFFNGFNYAPPFYNARLTITDSSITDNNAFYDDGGGVYARNSGAVTLTGCTITGNRCDDDGGGLAVDGSYRVTIDGCDIQYNYAYGGPRGGGGGVFVNDTLYGQVTIQNSTISNNESSFHGGGIYVARNRSAPLFISNTTIESNSAEQSGGGAEIRRFYEDDSPVIILNSQITSNTCDEVGGGISFNRLNGSDCPITIQNTTFTDNTSYYGGGGIYVERNGSRSPLTITSALIVGNTAEDWGGGLAFIDSGDNSPVTISDSIIFGNTANDDSGGGILLYDFTSYNSDFTLRDCVIANNYAQENGGGFTFYQEDSDANSSVIIDRCRITGNTASEGDGGGIHVYLYYDSAFSSGAIFKISNSTIDGNFADDDGGGIYFYADDGSNPQVLQIENSTVSNNVADDNGGGIYFEANNDGLVIKNSTISGNTAEDGGGIYIEDSYFNIQILNCTIANNYAYEEGGGIGNDESRILLRGTIVSGNSAFYSGDDLDGGSFYAEDSLIEDPNGVNDNGGNIFYVPAELEPLANNGGPTKTHALSISSPAIDAGINAALSAFDQRGSGFPRTVGTQTDIGAFEFNEDAPPPEGGLFGFGDDSDGDGFSDDVEDAAGTDANDPTDTPLGGTILGSEADLEPLSLLKIQVGLKFNATGKDTIKVKGRFALPDGTSVAGESILVDISGVVFAAVLSDNPRGSKGVAANGKISVKAPKGGVAAFTLTMKGDFAATLEANAGMENETTAGEAKFVRVALAFGQFGAFRADTVLSYKAKQGSSGKAK